MKNMLLIISLICFPFISYADQDGYAHDRGNRGYHFWNVISQRLDRQCDRIENGIINGSLTQREAKNLQHRQRRLQQRTDRLRYHYQLSNYDKRELSHRLDEASENIYRLKHNDYYAQKRHYHHSDSYQPYYEKNVARLSNDSLDFYVRF